MRTHTVGLPLPGQSTGAEKPASAGRLSEGDLAAPLQIAVVSGSLSESSATSHLGEKVGAAVTEVLGAAGVSVHLVPIPLKDLAHSIVNALLAHFPDPQLEKAFAAIENSAAVLAFTPAYNASYSGLFKLFFDVLDVDTLRGKPMIIGATGGSPRHSLILDHELRPMFAYLHASVAPTGIFVATEDWGMAAADSDSAGGSSLEKRIRQAARELAILMRADIYASGQLPAGAAPSMERHDVAERRGSALSVARNYSGTHGKGRDTNAAQATHSLSAEELVGLAPEELYPDFKSFEQLM
ncbi:MAG: NAD(P)H-dependent oxidoreductase [Arcanobacterium sp.]|nr:NAD(P)H-dependent oxidoreductase [Arcanobacterium sp.]MDY5589903.1 CE1759 family FMN reductase [Arcanobacterium sp.]